MLKPILGPKTELIRKTVLCTIVVNREIPEGKSHTCISISSFVYSHGFLHVWSASDVIMPYETDLALV